MDFKNSSRSYKINQEEIYHNACEDENYKALVKRLKITSEQAFNNTVKLQDCAQELKNCKGCRNLYNCQNAVPGHVFFPNVKESNLVFSYVPCKYQKQAIKSINEKNTTNNVLKNARMKDLKVTKNRAEVIKWIKAYFDNYNPYEFSKGLYLHGNFGTGKSYIIAALFNEIKNKYNVETEIIYVPELLRRLKENLNVVGEKLDYLEHVPLLLLDDIGAEKVTEWGRDEIIGTILQTRMNNGYPTFFTSNLKLDELEKALSITKDSEDTLKAKRILERIKYLTCDIELLGNNYREENN